MIKLRALAILAVTCCGCAWLGFYTYKPLCDMVAEECLATASTAANEDPILIKLKQAYKRKKYDQVLGYAQQVKEKYLTAANRLQPQIDYIHTGPEHVSPTGDPYVTEKTQEFGPLNAVALAMYLEGKSYLALGKKEEAAKTFRDLVSKFSYGQCFVPSNGRRNCVGNVFRNPAIEAYHNRLDHKVQLCPGHAESLVDKLGVPAEDILSCGLKSRSLIGSEEFHIVQVEYKEKGCSENCKPITAWGAVSADKSVVAQLPVYGLISSSAAYDRSYDLFDELLFKTSEERQYTCCLSLMDVTEFQLARESGRIGWKLSFKKPFECSWDKTPPEKPLPYIRLRKQGPGPAMRQTLDGSVFAYLKDGQLQIDSTQLNVSSKLGQPLPCAGRVR